MNKTDSISATSRSDCWELLACIYQEDTNSLANLLGKGVSPNCYIEDEKEKTLFSKQISKGGDIEPPLIAAVDKGNTAIIKLLLDYGAEVNQVTARKSAPLIGAVLNNRIDLVLLLLEYKADVNIATADPPILHASEMGNVGIFQLLLEKGADLTATGIGKVTALMYASVLGHIDIVNILLDKMVPINSRDEEGRTALWWARKGKKKLIEQLLLSKGAIE